MRKREKIRILKRALERLEGFHAHGDYTDGICTILSIYSDFETPDTFGINLPKRNRHGYSWPLTAKGAAIRRRVLNNAIKRLEK